MIYAFKCQRIWTTSRYHMYHAVGDERENNNHQPSTHLWGNGENHVVFQLSTKLIYRSSCEQLYESRKYHPWLSLFISYEDRHFIVTFAFSCFIICLPPLSMIAVPLSYTHPKTNGRRKEIAILSSMEQRQNAKRRVLLPLWFLTVRYRPFGLSKYTC